MKLKSVKLGERMYNDYMSYNRLQMEVYNGIEKKIRQFSFVKNISSAIAPYYGYNVFIRLF